MIHTGADKSATQPTVWVELQDRKPLEHHRAKVGDYQVDILVDPTGKERTWVELTQGRVIWMRVPSREPLEELKAKSRYWLMGGQWPMNT